MCLYIALYRVFQISCLTDILFEMYTAVLTISDHIFKSNCASIYIVLALVTIILSEYLNPLFYTAVCDEVYSALILFSAI